MMEEVQTLRSPLFEMFRKETCVGEKIVQLLKGINLRPILISSLIKIMREESIADILKEEKNYANKNAWFLNYWLKTTNLMAMQIVSQLRDQNGNSYKDTKFLQEQEFQPAIIELDKLILGSLKTTAKILYNKDKILELVKWSDTEAAGLLIFDNSIFTNKTNEAKLIWSEISENILYHVAGMIDNPISWALEHRFWMNSEIFCDALGLDLFDKNGIKNPIGNEINVDLSITQLIEAELDKNAIIKLLATNRALKMSKNKITGDLPIRTETEKSKETLEIDGMEMMEEITFTSEDQVSAFMQLAVIKLKAKIKYTPDKSEFLINDERMSPQIMADILEDLELRNKGKQGEAMSKLKLSNAEWIRVIDIAGTGDTIDTKNIITLWNTIKDNNEENLDILSDRIKIAEPTCDYFEYRRGRKRVCNNLINLGEQNCSLHKALKANNEAYNKNQSLFPVIFGQHIFYVEAEKPDSSSLFAPKTYEITRELATDQFIRARGKIIKKPSIKTYNPYLISDFIHIKYEDKIASKDRISRKYITN